MEAWAREYLDVWHQRTEDIGKGLLEGIEKDPATVGKYRLEDMVQIVRGVGAMMAEELEARGNDARDAYLNSVIPSMVAQGEKVAMLAAQTINIVLRIHGDIIPRISEQHRAQADDFFIAWETKYMFDLVTVGIEAGATG